MMDPGQKKTVLRMIPYGLYVLTAAAPDGRMAAATINWITHASFEPPLVVVCVKSESFIHALIEETRAFALNILGKGKASRAFTFFKPSTRDGQTLRGDPFRIGGSGAPLLESTPAFLECNLVDSLKRGDHTIFAGEVVNAGIGVPIQGRPDEATLWLRDLGEKIFYGG